LSLVYLIEQDDLQFHSFSFFFMAEQYSIVYMYHIFFIRPLAVEDLNWFYSLDNVNSAAINMDVQVSLLYADLPSFEYMHRNGITRSYGSYTLNFWGTFILISIVATLIYIPTISV
jgi:hypothetical protein